jgi:hypothetical protein
MKLPSIYTDLCLKQVFENASNDQKLALPLGCEQCELQVESCSFCLLFLFQVVQRQVQFTGGHFGQLKNKPITL